MSHNKTDKIVANAKHQHQQIVTRSASSSSLNNLLDEKTNKRLRDDDATNQSDIQSLDELWTRIDKAFGESNQRIEAKIETCMEKINCLETQLAAVKDECCSNAKSFTAAVSDVRDDLAATDEYVARLEKASELIISAVPFVPNENLKGIFEHIAGAIGCNTLPIVNLKRLARTAIKPGEAPAIVCQFALRLDRDAFYRKYLEQRNLNLSHIGFQSNNRIFVNENLTLLARSIRAEALKLKREGQLLQVYTKDGIVFAKSTTAARATACYTVAHLEKFRKTPPT